MFSISNHFLVIKNGNKWLLDQVNMAGGVEETKRIPNLFLNCYPIQPCTVMLEEIIFPLDDHKLLFDETSMETLQQVNV